MNIKILQIQLEEYAHISELQEEDQKLVQKAWEACDTAYAPYSKFNVGAALLLENGEVITANNQENAAYPSGLCAERVAMFYASSKYPGVAMKTIAVAVKSDHIVLHEPASPCGSCRQVMAEYQNLHQMKMKVILGRPDSKIQILHGVESLLPLSFTADQLKK